MQRLAHHSSISLTKIAGINILSASTKPFFSDNGDFKGKNLPNIIYEERTLFQNRNKADTEILRIAVSRSLRPDAISPLSVNL